MMYARNNSKKNKNNMSSRPPLMIQQSNTMTMNQHTIGALYEAELVSTGCDINSTVHNQDNIYSKTNTNISQHGNLHTNIDAQENKTEYPETQRRYISSVSSIGDVLSVDSPKSPSIMGMDRVKKIFGSSSIDSDDESNDGEAMFNFLKKLTSIKDDETFAKHGMYVIFVSNIDT